MTDWIKMRTDLYRDPKVCAMADALLVTLRVTDAVTGRALVRNAVVGGLVAVWGVARSRGHRDGDDLRLTGCPLRVIDDIADVPGFGDAMAAVGWARATAEGAVLPRFFGEFNAEKMTGPSSNAERQRRFRERKRAERSAAERDAEGLAEAVTKRNGSNGREEKKREEKEEDSSEPAPPSSEPAPVPVLEFPTVGNGPRSWPLLRPQLDEWAAAYPHLDVPTECRRALAWVRANPGKKKTARGMPAFLVRWFGNATDRPASPRAAPPPPPPTRSTTVYDPVAPDPLPKPKVTVRLVPPEPAPTTDRTARHEPPSAHHAPPPDDRMPPV